MFVTLCTILIPLVSYTPVTPKLLIILFSLGFIFAVPAYIFLLPQMTHWLELAIFLFGYAFIGFYVFQGPVSIFFLFGLLTLGIQNTMSYHVDAILLSIVMFYMVCATLIISVHFPFSSKPERIYASLRYRFFRHCAKEMRRQNAGKNLIDRLLCAWLGSGAPLLLKMEAWGPKIDASLTPDNSQQYIVALNRNCGLFYRQLQALTERRKEFNENALIATTQQQTQGNLIATLCHRLANRDTTTAFKPLQSGMASIEKNLDELLGDDYLDKRDQHQLALFYIYLNLQASMLDSLEACRDAQNKLDWQRLGETRF